MCERNIYVLCIQVKLSLWPVAAGSWRQGVLGSLLLPMQGYSSPQIFQKGELIAH